MEPDTPKTKTDTGHPEDQDGTGHSEDYHGTGHREETDLRIGTNPTKLYRHRLSSAIQPSRGLGARQAVDER